MSRLHLRLGDRYETLTWMVKKRVEDMDGVRRIVLIPDIHYPFEDRKACESVLKYCAANHVDEFVQLGDLLDINSVSAHNKGKPRLVEGERLMKDYTYAGKRLDEWTQAVRTKNTDCTLALLQGNHEQRVNRFVEEHPALEGLIEPHIGLDLKRRGIRWIESYPKGELYKSGHMYAHHGLYCGSHPAKKHVDHYGVNIFTGHCHTVQVHSKVLHGKNKTLIGATIGCLCRLDMPYLLGAPTAWQTAFAVIHMLPNGFFSWNIVSIFNGEFVGPDGHKYSWRGR